jgi:pyruvate,water dikinase
MFYLDLTEILGLTTASTVPEALRGIVAARQATFAKFRVDTAPPERFQTRGPQHRHAEFESSAQSAPPPTGPQRKGLGCCAGVIRGRVRVVLDPAHAKLEQGEILVARQTDPGWVMLFPMASGLLVERGSLLSHSAIVAREMGLPAVVGITDLCQWLQTGEEVEFDGKTGVVTKIG